MFMYQETETDLSLTEKRLSKGKLKQPSGTEKCSCNGKID